MKAALAASLVFGFSSMAMADVKVNGDVATYYGQYNTGEEGYAAHFANASEGHIKVTGKQGPISMFLEVESRDDRYGTGNNLNNLQLAATWASGPLSVKMGTVTTGLACEFALSSGLKTTTTLGLGAAGGCAGYYEQDGIQATYMIPAIKGAAMLTIMPSTGGQIMALGATGMIADMVGFRFNQSNNTTDDFTDDTDDAVTDSEMHVGVKVPLGSAKMLLSLEMNTTLDKEATNPVTQAATDKDLKRSDMAVQFTGKDMGPGTLIFTYATKNMTFDGDAVVAISDMDLVYRFDLAKGVGFDVFYLSQASLYDSDVADFIEAATGNSPDITKTFIGGGFFASF